MSRRVRRTRSTVLADLGLQGGGAHGAFTWGVLDRLLEERWLEYDGTSGTSAGAMNAAVMIGGFAAGGADGARTALERFWKAVSDASRISPLKRGPLEVITGSWTPDHSPMFVALDLAARLMSPSTTCMHWGAIRSSASCSIASISTASRRNAGAACRWRARAASGR